ncbi:MAG: hypothetical protein WKF71_14980 [Pyrinomonadaceae bacterium]
MKTTYLVNQDTRKLMKPIIKVENLSKQYKVGIRPATYTTLRETVSKIARSPLEILSRRNRNEAGFVLGSTQRQL